LIGLWASLLNFGISTINLGVGTLQATLSGRNYHDHNDDEHTVNASAE
jgi:hypothetical protein